MMGLVLSPWSLKMRIVLAIAVPSQQTQKGSHRGVEGWE